MTLHDPWLLLLLVLIPLVWLLPGRRRRAAVCYSSVDGLRRVAPSWRIRARWVLPALRTTALVLLVIALARPQKGNEQTQIRTEGIAIQLLVDRSGSMQALDFRLNGKPVDRLTAVRKVVRDFVAGGDGLAGRQNDIIGMVTFARFPDSKSPLTLDHGYLLDTLDRATPAATRNEDGTAIGDAIALGVERLRSLDQEKRLPAGQRIRSRIMVLLTDGENNFGDIEPLKAAEMAATVGIKIYTIGAGTEGFAPIPVPDPNTGRPVLDPQTGEPVLRSVPVRIDEESLKKIADTTGGKYYRATDTDSLRRIYADIDKLEKTRTEEKRFLQYKELATDSVRVGRLRLPPLLLVAFGLLTIEVLMSSTVLRRLP